MAQSLPGRAGPTRYRQGPLGSRSQLDGPVAGDLDWPVGQDSDPVGAQNRQLRTAKIAALPDECGEYAPVNSSSLLPSSVMDPEVVGWAESDLTMGYEVIDLCCSASIQRWEWDRRPRGVSSASGM
jgi:hypothetical protein